MPGAPREACYQTQKPRDHGVDGAGKTAQEVSFPAGHRTGAETHPGPGEQARRHNHGVAEPEYRLPFLQAAANPALLYAARVQVEHESAMVADDTEQPEYQYRDQQVPPVGIRVAQRFVQPFHTDGDEGHRHHHAQAW